MFPHGLGQLKTWFLDGIIVWEGLGGTTLDGGSVLLGMDFKVRPPHLLTVCCLCFRFAVHGVNSQLPAPASMPATFYHAVSVSKDPKIKEIIITIIIIIIIL